MGPAFRRGEPPALPPRITSPPRHSLTWRLTVPPAGHCCRTRRRGELSLRPWPTRPISARPRALRRVMSAMPIGIPAVGRSGSRDATLSPKASVRASSPRPDVEDDRPVRPSRSCVHRAGGHTEDHCGPSRRCSGLGFDASAQAKPALGLSRPRYGSGMLRSPAIGNRPRASRLRRSKPASRRRGKPVPDRVRWIGFDPEQPKRPRLSGLRRRQSVGLIESSV